MSMEKSCWDLGTGRVTPKVNSDSNSRHVCGIV